MIILLRCVAPLSSHVFLFRWEDSTQNFAIVLKLINCNTDATDQIEIYIICHGDVWRVRFFLHDYLIYGYLLFICLLDNLIHISICFLWCKLCIPSPMPVLHRMLYVVRFDVFYLFGSFIYRARNEQKTIET